MPLQRRRDPYDFVWKGVSLAAIGAGIVFSPFIMAAGSARDVIAQSAPVGWFSLVLGVAFIAHFLWQRANRGAPPSGDKR